MTTTSMEKRQQRIAQLQARLQQEKAKLSAERRRRRTGHLIALGLLLSHMYEHGSSDERRRIESLAAACFESDARNLARATEAIEGLKGAPK